MTPCASTERPLDIVVLGLSLSSSWGNGHATTYRSLLRALALRGHTVLFLERHTPWYAAHRDLEAPSFCALEFYEDPGDLTRRFADRIRGAEAVVVGSFVPDGITVSEIVLELARGTRCFYDIDTPVTLAAIEAGRCAYLARAQIPRYDIYLSFTGGPILKRLKDEFGSPAPQPLYCSADESFAAPRNVPKRWHLGYVGTYSEDRQPWLDELLIEPARRAPAMRFLVAGAQYPTALRWPANVDHIEHVSPSRLPEVYASQHWTLNLTRADMREAGFSPSVRLFEAAASGTPVISDTWPGLETFFVPGIEISTAKCADEVLLLLSSPEPTRHAIALAARRRFELEHAASRRARALEGYLATTNLQRRFALNVQTTAEA